MVPAPDLLDDGVRISRPDEGSGLAVMLLDEAVDRLPQRDQRVERAAPQAPTGQSGEEGLDRVEPRARGRDEVEGPARVAPEPSHSLRVLAGAVVVEDGVDQLAGRY